MTLFPSYSLTSILVALSGSVRSYKYEHPEPTACMVFHPVFFSCWSHGALPCEEYSLFGADLKRSLPLQNNINLVLMAMYMDFLFLARLKTVDITKEAIRLEDVVLLHLLTTEQLEVGKRDNIHHKYSTGLMIRECEGVPYGTTA